MAEKWHVGNANTDGESTRGWLLGHFIGEADDPRTTTAVEVKWGATHDAVAPGSGPLPPGPVGRVDHAGEGRRLRRLGSRDRPFLAGRGGLHRDHRAMALDPLHLMSRAPAF